MKIFFLKSVIVITLFAGGYLCNEGQAMEKPATNLVTFANQVPALDMYLVSLEYPEILPAAMITCKDWYEKTQPVCKDLTTVYASLSVSKGIAFISEFEALKKEIAPQSKMTPDECFKLLFIKIALGKDDKRLELFNRSSKSTINVLNGMLLCISSMIRNYVQQYTKFPKGLLEQFNPKFQYLDIPLKFSYLKMFELRFKVNRFFNLGDVSILRNFFNIVCELDEKKKELPALSPWNSFLSLTDSSLTDSSNNFLFKPIRAPLLNLYKLVLVDKNLSEKFFNNSTNILPHRQIEMMRKIPVNFATLSADIECLKKQVDNDILQLEEKWETVVTTSYHNYRLLQQYLQIG